MAELGLKRRSLLSHLPPTSEGVSVLTCAGKGWDPGACTVPWDPGNRGEGSREAEQWPLGQNLKGIRGWGAGHIPGRNNMS